MKKKLSVKQSAILEYIQIFLDDHQFPPTVRDIQGGCDISSTSVVDYNLRILQRDETCRQSCAGPSSDDTAWANGRGGGFGRIGLPRDLCFVHRCLVCARLLWRTV